MNHVFFKRYTHVRLKRYTHEQMSLTYWFVFVYDREEKDVLRVKELNGKYLNRAITPEEKDGRDKGGAECTGFTTDRMEHAAYWGV